MIVSRPQPATSYILIFTEQTKTNTTHHQSYQMTSRSQLNLVIAINFISDQWKQQQHIPDWSGTNKQQNPECNTFVKPPFLHSNGKHQTTKKQEVGILDNAPSTILLFFDHILQHYNFENKAIMDIRLRLCCAIPPPPLQPISHIACDQKFSKYYLRWPGKWNDPVCCMMLLAIQWSRLQQTRHRRCSDRCNKDC